MKYTNKKNLPDALVQAIIKTTEEYEDFPELQNYISVTRLIDAPFQYFETKKNWDNLTKDVYDMMWAFEGTSKHSVLEKASSLGIKETRFIHRFSLDHRDHEGMSSCYDWHVGGQIDLFNFKDDYLEDYKNTSAWTFHFNPEGKKEWIEQLNINAYLMGLKGLKVKGLRIHGILRDWDKKMYLQMSQAASKAEKQCTYPELRVKTIELPLWSEEDQLDFIMKRLEVFQSWNGEVCTDKEKWYSQKYIKTTNTTIDNYARCEGYCSLTEICPFYQQKLENTIL